MLPHSDAKDEDRDCASPTGRRAGDHVAKLCCRGRKTDGSIFRRMGSEQPCCCTPTPRSKTEAVLIQLDEEQATMSRSSAAEVEKTAVSMPGRTGSEQPCCRTPQNQHDEACREALVPRSRRPMSACPEGRGVSSHAAAL